MQALNQSYNSSPKSQPISLEKDGKEESREESSLNTLVLNSQFCSVSDLPAQYNSSLFGQNETTLLSSIKAAHNAEANQSSSLESKYDAVGSIENQLKISIPLTDSANVDDPFFSPTSLPLSAALLSDQITTPSPRLDVISPVTPGGSKRNRSKAHTPRPANSFILYRREKHAEIMAQYRGDKSLNNNLISKIVANMWRSESTDVKAHYAAKAEAEKQAHMLKYPDYKYRPRKSISKASPKTKTATSSSEKSSDGEQKKSEKQKSLKNSESGRNEKIKIENAQTMNVIPNFYVNPPYMFPIAFPHHPQMANYPIHVTHLVETNDGGARGIHPFELGLREGYENPDFFQHPMLATEYGHPWPDQPVIWETDFGLSEENQK